MGLSGGRGKQPLIFRTMLRAQSHDTAKTLQEWQQQPQNDERERLIGEKIAEKETIDQEIEELETSLVNV